MIALNNYQLAEREMRLIYFRYKGLSKAKLKKSLLISDIDAYLKKWSRKIVVLKVEKNRLNEELETLKQTQEASQDDIVAIYKRYLKTIYLTIVTINVLRMDQNANKICSKIDRGIEKYCNNHNFEYYY